jgi:hypothetical protein
MKGIIAAFMVFGVLPLFSQVDCGVVFSRDTVELGEFFTVQLAEKTKSDPAFQAIIIDLDAAINIVYEQDTFLLDPFADMLALQGSNQVPEQIVFNPAAANESFRLAIYNPGVFILTGSCEKETGISDCFSMQIYVKIPEGITDINEEIEDIKDILEIPASRRSLWLTLILMLLLVFLVFLWLKKRRKAADIPTETHESQEPIIVIPPDVIALQALEDLHRRAPWRIGEITAYQSELTNIVRTYISAATNVPALELTTEETLSALKSSPLSSVHVQQLSEILQVADLVKFAKKEPGVDIHHLFLDKARLFVLESRGILLARPANDQNPGL